LPHLRRQRLHRHRPRLLWRRPSPHAATDVLRATAKVALRVKANHAAADAAAKAANAVTAGTASAAADVAANVATENVKAVSAASRVKAKPKCEAKRKPASRANHANRAKVAPPATENAVADAVDAATWKCVPIRLKR
jgi:hypothetical protein